MKEIIPAILTNNLQDLKRKLEKLIGLFGWVQIDLMDGKFVPNTSIGLEELARVSIKLNLEIHLMVMNPENFFSQCQRVGAKRVVFHLEATKNPDYVLKQMERFNFQRGIALNPETSPEQLRPYLDRLDSVLILGVHPGFQGQKFIPEVLKKVEKIRKLAPKVKIGIDGGINLENVEIVAKFDPDFLIIGSALFKESNLKQTLKKFKQKIQLIRK